jgi:hypothetical protein
MRSQSPPEQWTPVDRSQLAALIDKLVAVQLDLKPLCDDAGSKVEEAKVQTVVAEACEVLQSAIDDLKQVIFRLEGFPGMVESPPSLMKGSGSE